MKIKTITAPLTGVFVAGVLASTLVVSANVHAQAPTKAAAGQAVAPAAPAVAAPVTVTPEMRAAIKELIDITKTRENLAKTFQMMSQNLPPQMAQAMNASIENNASLSTDQKQRVRANMNQPFDSAVKEAMTIVSDPKVVDESMERMYPIYAKHYTVAEIKEITAFYKTPTGGKSLTTMPLVINESMQAGISIFQPRLNALMEKTIKKEVDTVSKPAAPKK